MNVELKSRLVSSILAAAICLSTAVSLLPAAANRHPLVEIIPLDPFTLPAGDSGCDFPMALSPLANKEKLTTFFDAEGNVRLQIVTGVRKVQLTNLSTGKVISLNISGPAQIRQNSDGTTTISVEGEGVLLFAPGVAPEFPRQTYLRGRVVGVGDAFGNITKVVKLDGTVQDVCTLLS